MTVELTDQNFEEIVLKADKPVVVDFWAEWCGPCRMVGPIIHELSEDFADRVIMGKVDVDSNPGTASRFSIRNIPTLLFFKNGTVVDKQVGALPKAALAKKVEGLL